MRMVLALIFVFSCLLSWTPGGLSAEVVTTRLGGVARLNCSAPTGGSVEWKRKLPKEFSYIYVHPWLHKPYDIGGRHNVSLDPLTGAGDLVITNVTEGDAGKYYCTETIGRIETHFELVVLLDDNPTCRTNISLTNVLVDNDCDLDPDYIEFNCSIAYRGNVPPDMQLQMSSIGVLDNVTVQTWQQSTTTYMSVVWASKASWRMRDGRFRCQVRNAMVGIQPTCSSTQMSVIYFYKSKRTLKMASNQDNQAQVNCAANTSEHCSYSWREKFRDSSKSSDHSEVLGQTLDLKSRDVDFSSMRCRAECRIRDKVCVSEPMFIEFPPDKGGEIIIPAIIVPIVVVILVIIIVILALRWRSQRSSKSSNRNRDSTDKESFKMSNLTGKQFLEFVDENQIILRETLETDDGLAEHLISNHVLNSDQYQCISTGWNSYQKQNQELLRYILNISDDSIVHSICEVFTNALLKTNQRHVANFVHGVKGLMIMAFGQINDSS